MRKFAIIVGVFALLAGCTGCVNDPTLDDTVLTDVDSSTETVEVVDASTDVVVNSDTSTEQ